MKKLLCAECYNTLVIHEYDIGIFVDVCECQVKKVEEAEILAYDGGYEEGYDLGRQEGYDEGYDEGYVSCEKENASLKDKKSIDKKRNLVYVDGYKEGFHRGWAERGKE